MTDQELLEEIAKGNSDAFTVLYNKYWRLLYVWSTKRIFDREAVLDLQQNVWADIWLKPEMIKTNAEGSAKSILLGFVSYRILDFFKKKNILVLQTLESEFLESDEKLSYSHVFEELEVKEIHAIIDNIIGKLPEIAQEIYILSERKNLSAQEIAERLSVKEETVRRRLTWINSILRSELSKCYLDRANSLLLVLYAQEFLK
jgi:RNA polymerase sigma factor (sigma-70 family)